MAGRTTTCPPCPTQPQSRLSATTLERVRAATGFDTITTVGPYSIRNPLTKRINRLETERDILRFEECAEVMVGRARFLHQGWTAICFGASKPTSPPA